MALLGIDVGSTGCKAIIFDLNGQLLKSAYRSYPMLYPQPGWRELDSEQVFSAVLECIEECCAGGIGPRVRSLSVSAQGEALVPIDRSGCALANSMVSFDTRDIAETGWIRNNLDLDYITEKTGVPLHTMFSLPKILWIKNHDPGVYAKTWKFLCFADYVAFRLGADVAPTMDHSLASRTMLFNIPEKKWDASLINAAAIDGDKLPALAPCGTPLGTVKEIYRKRFGFTTDLIIATGGHDQVCCALGAGVLSGGDAMNSMGTTDSIVCVSPVFTSGKRQMEANIPCGSYGVSDLYAAHSFVLSTGSVIQWFRNTFYGGDARTSYAELDAQAQKIGKPSGLYLLPHFSGSGTPYLDSSSKGIFAGLSLETEKAEIYRAILEGICYELRVNIENMESAGISIERMKCIGGAAKSDFYLQLKADITGKPIIKQRVEEAGCLGAALLAGRAAGLIPDTGAILRRFTSEEKTFLPNPVWQDVYSSCFEKYKSVYTLSRTLFS
ncbi:FGGY-family carbohydrate kinase [Treponema primitia]|uniref:FGGY-family carbohydrate kinase n=1 Tax=Treponema primitia TaxID=88058 RepID=UPI0002554EB4|nr:FGGY-family carbohydrate kinase [Treponema primitia]